MDAVVIALICTFVVMLATGAVAMGFQRPPMHWEQLTCPEDHRPVLVALGWRPEEHQMSVVGCDHRCWKEEQCRKGCEPSVRAVFSELIPTTVVA